MSSENVAPSTAPPPAPSVRQISPDEWMEYRDVRLRALKTDPSAFSSNFEKEAELDEGTWRRRTQATVGLYMGASLVGITGAISSAWLEESERDASSGQRMCEIVSVWIAPEARGQGHAPMLLQGALALAKKQGYQLANISMKSCNARAIHLYTKLGFRPRDVSLTSFKPDSYGCDVRLQIAL